MIKKKKFRKTGLPPGTIIYTGDKKIEEASLVSIVYDKNEINQFVSDKSFNLPAFVSDKNTWIDLRGLFNVELIKQLGEELHIHPMILEDITDIYQRPKWEENDQGCFFLAKTLKYNSERKSFYTEQISVVFNERILITFQEQEDDSLEIIRERMQMGKGRIREKKVDYLAYAILDLILDKHYEVLDDIEDELEKLEDAILNDPLPEHKESLYYMKRHLLKFRKHILPVREVISSFERSQHPAVSPSSKRYIKDLSDNIITLQERVETFREMLFSIQELYVSEQNIRMNQVIQWLTIITALFVPVTFIAGIFGMNFEHIPFTQPRYGFLIICLIMIILMIMLIYVFKKKKWI